MVSAMFTDEAAGCVDVFDMYIRGRGCLCVDVCVGDVLWVCGLLWLEARCKATRADLLCTTLNNGIMCVLDACVHASAEDHNISKEDVTVGLVRSPRSDRFLVRYEHTHTHTCTGIHVGDIRCSMHVNRPHTCVHTHRGSRRRIALTRRTR